MTGTITTTCNTKVTVRCGGECNYEDSHKECDDW